MQYNNLIIFDGICNLCNSSIQFIIKKDSQDLFKFVPLQSSKAKRLLGKYQLDLYNLDTVILIHNKNIFVKSDAALLIAKILGYPWKMFYFFRFIPKFIRDRIYAIVAENRYRWFGKREKCMIPSNDIKQKFII